jgi:hypothetical protein
MNMDKVESVKIDQSILGRMLDYGNVKILGTGEGFETLRTIPAQSSFETASSLERRTKPRIAEGWSEYSISACMRAFVGTSQLFGAL